MSYQQTMFDKIWEMHLIKKLEDQNDLIAIDRFYS